MIIPGNWDLPNIILGTNYKYGFIIKEDGYPKDLTSCTVEVKLTNEPDGLEYTLTTSSGLEIVDLTAGIIEIVLDDSVVNIYSVNEYLYKLRITETTGEINCYLEGKIKVRE